MKISQVYPYIKTHWNIYIKYVQPLYTLIKLKNYINNRKIWQGSQKTRSLKHCCFKSKIVQPLYKTIWELPTSKQNMQLPHDLKIVLLGISAHERGTYFQTKTCKQTFIEALYAIAKSSQKPWCSSTDEPLNTMCYIHLMEYYTINTKEQTMDWWHAWVHLQRAMLCEKTSIPKAYMLQIPYIKWPSILKQQNYCRGEQTSGWRGCMRT